MRIVTTILDVLGAAAVSTGVAFIYWPAGVITAGVAVLAASYIAAASDGAPPREVDA